MERVIEQRVREAAKAARSGIEVQFHMRGGWDERKMIARYGGVDHAIFTGGSSRADFEARKGEVLELFRDMVHSGRGIDA